MKKLRLVQERKGEQQVSVDLRGLGGDPIFKHFEPKTVLTRDQSNHSETVSQVAQAMNLETEVTAQGHTHFTVRAQEKLDFKAQAVRLYTFAMSLSHLDQSGAKYSLWQTESFRHAMERAAEGTPATDESAKFAGFKPESLSHSGNLSLGEATRLHLTQAGFTEVEKSQGVLSQAELQTALKTQLSALDAQTSSSNVAQRKVG
jgi:hypothetical protein